MPRPAPTALELFYINKIRYYSFKINFESRKRNYIYLDVKIPATDIRSAIIMMYLEMEVINNTKSKRIYRTHDSYSLPKRSFVKSMFLKVTEYERKYTPKYGYTQHYYKKLRVWGQDEFTHYFKEKY